MIGFLIIYVRFVASLVAHLDLVAPDAVRLNSAIRKAN